MADTEPQADSSSTSTPDVRVVVQTETAQPNSSSEASQQTSSSQSASSSSETTEAKTAPVDPALASKVLRQVEFYFGNSNLPKDNHLRGLTQKNDGWVEIAHIASFPKMAQLTKDFNAIVTAIRGSKELLEVDETGTKLRRRMPVPDDLDLNPFSIYAKGFPADYTIEQVDAFFQPHLEAGEEIRCTRLRRLKDRTFKGSVFVEFSTQAAADRITKLELKAPDETKTEPLLILNKAAYFKQKHAARDAEKSQRRGKAGDKRKAEGEAETGDEEVGGKRKRDGGEGEEKRGFTRELTPGCIISVTNLPESVDKFKLSQAVAATGAKVAFVSINKGEPSTIRIGRDTEVSAKDAIAKLVQEDLKFEGQKPEFSILEGDAEKAHWEQVWDAQEKSQANRGRGGGRGGRGRGGGGRGRGGGRGGGKKQRRDD